MNTGGSPAVMRNQRPYLLRALNDWIVDSGCTPHIVVDATHVDVEVPASLAADARVVLNIAPAAVRSLCISNEALTFSGRFAGVAHEVAVPLAAVLAIYARENGAGMVFQPLPDDGPTLPPDGPAPAPQEPGGSSGPGLRIVR